MIDNPEEIVELQQQEAVVEIIVPPQAPPAKTLKQKETEAILAKIAPMLAILKTVGLAEKDKVQAVINLLKNSQLGNVVKLANELDDLINKPQELLAVIEHIQESNDGIIGDHPNSHITQMKDVCSIKTPLLAIGLIAVNGAIDPHNRKLSTTE